MVTDNATDVPKIKGPTGFIDFGGNMLIVDYGQIYLNEKPIGFLFEDGYLKDTYGPLGESNQYRPIDALPGCQFRGIDADGNELNLPGASAGPSGSLNYNGVMLNVINGRLATLDHHLVGTFDDQGTIYLKELNGNGRQLKLDQTTQLNTLFEGAKSTGVAWKHEFARQLYRQDRSYVENEISRYFVGFDKLTTMQKKYVLNTMAIWASSGILQVVRKSEGDASLGNVKHGAAGVTGVRTGNATFDKEEFDRDIEYYNKFGPLFVAARGADVLEVRLSLVVPHEFGHQLEFTLTQAIQDKITDIFRERRASCDKSHPAPKQYSGYCELVMKHQMEQRHFISGYAKTSMHEYWAECVAAFSAKETRQILKEVDPVIHQLLSDLFICPTRVLRIVLHETILALQASLRLGGEFSDDLLQGI